MEETIDSHVVPTGISGLDDILGGGLPQGKMYLLSGAPGTGKTTFSLQFMAEGIRRREQCLYIAVGGAGHDLASLAKAGGIFLDPEFFSLHMVEISGEILEGPEQRIFHPEEMEPSGAVKGLLAEIVRLKPKRLVIDSLSDLRFLTEDQVTFRRLVLAMRREFDSQDSTVLITDNPSQGESDAHLQTICHGVFRLEQIVLGYGPVRRRLIVVKLRGKAYRTGWHDFRIVTGGICVFPRLIAAEHRQYRQRRQIRSGNERLDLLFGGGLDGGSTTAIMGASGTGKTTLANLYAVAAAKRGECVVMYLFEETEASFRERAEGLGLGLDTFIESGLISLHCVDIAEFSAGEFDAMLRREVEERDVQTIVIDTLNGYITSMLEDKHLTMQLHELLTYLAHRGVTTLLAVEQHGIFGKESTPVESVSYLADSILLLRFFECRGEIRRAVSVVKKRMGRHETTIRELTFSKEGIAIGEPLVEMQGVLTGVPTLEV